jgi:hypothetical protein
MNGLNFNEMLRYGASGVLAVLLAAIGFKYPVELLKSPDSVLSDGAVWLIILFTVGALGYSIYRAAIYPLIFRACLALLGRQVRLEDFVRDQWKNSLKTGALSPRLLEWGAQVHFLYGSAISSALIFIACASFGLEKTERFSTCLCVILTVFLAGSASQIRYLLTERWVTEHDKSLP